MRIERVFDVFERAHDALAEHFSVKLRAHDPVTVLAGVRAAVLADQLERFLGDRAQLSDVFVVLDVEHRAHVQTPDGRVRIPGSVRSVLFKDLRQARGVIGEVLEIDGAIFDDRDRLSRRLSSTS